MTKQYLTADEVAKMLLVSRQTVSSWCRTGKLKAIRAGREWRIRPDDLDKFTLRGVPQQEENPKANGYAAVAA